MGRCQKRTIIPISDLEPDRSNRRWAAVRGGVVGVDARSRTYRDAKCCQSCTTP
jgi:hypothetical protein